MKKSLLYLFAFAVGASLGSAVTWHYTKKKYEKIAEEEIKSVKEVFSKKENDVNNRLSVANNLLKEKLKKEVIVEDITEDIVQDEDIDSTPDISEPEEHEDYEAVLRKAGYKNEPQKVTKDGPYVIPPEEFGEIEEYDKITLTFYADKIVADENNEIMDETEIQQSIGFESLGHFGEYENDSVFVRNDATNTDYEILLDTRNYMDVFDVPPHLVR